MTFRKRWGLIVGLALVGTAARSSADTFPAGSLIIPTDECYQLGQTNNAAWVASSSYMVRETWTSSTTCGYADSASTAANVSGGITRKPVDDADSLARYRELRALGRKLGAQVWPAVRITDTARAALADDLAALAPALREEAFLPDWEFQGEHKLPIIPEPLGIISLSRAERRVDPLSSLTAALAVVLVVLGLLAYFIARPPWVPGR